MGAHLSNHKNVECGSATASGNFDADVDVLDRNDTCVSSVVSSDSEAHPTLADSLTLVSSDHSAKSRDSAASSSSFLRRVGQRTKKVILDVEERRRAPAQLSSFERERLRHNAEVRLAAMERMQDGRRGALARAAALDPSTDPEQAELVLAEAQCAMAEIQDMRVTHEALRKLSVDES